MGTKSTKGEFLIFSLHSGSAEEIQHVCKHYPGFHIVAAQGTWGGREEPSYVVRLPDAWLHPSLHDQVRAYILDTLSDEGEDFALYVDTYRNAYLLPTDETTAPEYIGKFTYAMHEVKDRDYTMVYGQVFVVEEAPEYVAG